MLATDFFSKSSSNPGLYVSFDEFINAIGDKLPLVFIAKVEPKSAMVRKELLEVAKVLKIDNSKKVRKIIGSLFNERDGEFFLTYIYRFRRYLRELVVSQHYMGLVIHGTANIGGTEKTITKIYVIGINDLRDGLFVNEVNSIPVEVEERLIEIRFGMLINDSIRFLDLYYTQDDVFRKVFRYDIDVVDPKAVLSVKDDVFGITVYRVSGEISFELMRADLRTYLSNLFRRQLYMYTAYIGADIIIGILLDHGFNVPLNVRFVRDETDHGFGNDTTVRITVPGALTRKTDMNKLLWAFERLLEDYFTVEDVREDERTIWLKGPELKIFVRLSSRFTYGRPRGDLVIDVTMPNETDAESTGLYADMLDDIVKNIEDLMNTEQEYKFQMGNHLIRIINGVPINFTYKPKVEPTHLMPISLTVFEPFQYFVTPRTKIHIEHVEHGTKELSFDNFYLLQIRTTEVSDNFIEKRNLLALRRLIKQYT